MLGIMLKCKQSSDDCSFDVVWHLSDESREGCSEFQGGGDKAFPQSCFLATWKETCARVLENLGEPINVLWFLAVLRHIQCDINRRTNTVSTILVWGGGEMDRDREAERGTDTDREREREFQKEKSRNSEKERERERD